jgi:Domain of unknown function (DUF4786)
MKSFNVATTLVSLSMVVLLVSGKPLDKAEADAPDPVASSSSERGSKGSSRGARYLGGNPWFNGFNYLPPGAGGLHEQVLPRAAEEQNNNQADSPIYYIRLPPNPYVYMPGMGYVSRPSPPPAPSPPAVIPPRRTSPFIQLPLGFVANGKPGSTVQIWQNDRLPSTPAPTLPPLPQRKPVYSKPSIHKLPGPYFFNGKPSGFYILQQDPYNSLYADVLHNFYP